MLDILLDLSSDIILDHDIPLDIYLIYTHIKDSPLRLPDPSYHQLHWMPTVDRLVVSEKQSVNQQ